MKKLNLQDTFKTARLIKNGNLTPIIKNAFAEGKKEGADSEQIGLETFLDIIASCSDVKTEQQLYELLAGPTEKTPEAIATQSLEAVVEDFKAICKENNITNFLKSASRLSQSIKG